MIDRFNIRVYGICFRNNSELLLSDEKAGGMEFTKFPGGGLEYGEGIIDCLHREFDEELGAKIEVIEHYYTTEDFVQSAFRKRDQIISIYYHIKLLDNITTRMVSSDRLSFRWVALEDLKADELRFPIDKIVLAKLQAQKLQ